MHKSTYLLYILREGDGEMLEVYTKNSNTYIRDQND